MKTIVLCLNTVLICGKAKLMLPELYSKGCDWGSVKFWRRHNGVQLQQGHYDSFSPQLSQLDWPKIPKRSVRKEEKEKSRRRFGEGRISGSV